MTCAHCGTPVYGRAPAGPAYCCLGCAILGGMGDSATGAPTRQARSLLLRLGLAAFFSANTMVLSLFLYSLEAPGAEAPGVALSLIRALLALFSAPAFALLAPPFFQGMKRDLGRGRFSMESLIALSAGAAFLYSCLAVVRGSNHVYFDTATVILLLVTAGRLLEANARVRGTRALRELMELAPPEARVRRGGEWQVRPAESLVPGDTVQVRPGERVPVDGRIAAGGAAVDESMLTGEALPAERLPGEVVRAGSLCLNGVLEIETLAVSRDSLLARIIRSVEAAQQARSPLERLADRTAAAFVPLAAGLALLAVFLWWPGGREQALLAGLSVLVVACPCALGIAVPLVNVLALGAAARHGILIRSAETLERLAASSLLALDKTGTVTRGCISVRRVIAFNGETEETVLAKAAAAAADSTHPVSRAIEELARRSGVPAAGRRKVEVFPGLGAGAELEDGSQVLLGRRRWIEDRSGAFAGVEEFESGSLTWCAQDGRPLGAFVLDDPVSEEAVQAVAATRRMGLRAVLLSGDRKEVVRAAGSLLGAEAQGELLPEEKAARIRALRQQGEIVAMAGDGINDAAALASADTGIAVSGGTDVAREVAEVVLLEGGLSKLPWLFRLARRARRVARQNLGWTLAYNSIALSLAVSGRLRPILAALLMLGSSILVISNSLRVNREDL